MDDTEFKKALKHINRMDRSELARELWNNADQLYATVGNSDEGRKLIDLMLTASDRPDGKIVIIKLLKILQESKKTDEQQLKR